MRKKLFITYVAIILFLSLILGFYFINVSKTSYTQEYEQHMVKEVQMLGYALKDQVDKQGLDALDNFASSYAEKYEYRITIVDSEGNVLSDSSTDERYMENHKARLEIQQALSGQTGLSTRYSQSLKTDFIYTAVSVDTLEGIIVLRLAVPLLALTQIRYQVIINIFGGIFLAACVAFVIAYFFAGRIVRPLNELTRAAEEIARGDFSKKIPQSGSDQIRSLTKAFNQMSMRLNTTIDQLESENIKLESIVNSMINGVLAIDNNDRILMINDMCSNLFQIKLQHIIGYNFYDLIQNETIFKIIEEVKEKKEHVEEEFSFKIGLQGNLILRVYANPIARQHEKDEMMGILLVFQDVTQIRKLEQLRNDFVSNVTHELKTPLTSIMGFTDTLKSGAIYDTQAALRFVDIIDIEAKRLYRLIQDILALSEIETRDEDINVSNHNVKEIFMRTYSILDSSAKAKGLTLEYFIDEDLPPFSCNADRLSQMIINLVDNAIKYTEKGGVTVRCTKEEEHLKIVVLDTGIGIPEKCMDRIFERFYRVDKGRSRKAGGTGLGLSIVKHIVFLYKGSIHVESKEGSGSTFTILLPY